jgi:hypothetical protein
MSNGTAGDGIDNDCDGLIDEEYCSDSREPGTFGELILLKTIE